MTFTLLFAPAVALRLSAQLNDGLAFTTFNGVVQVALMLLWANKVSLWKDKSLMENDKKTSQKKDRSLIFYKDIASYATHTEYLRDFLGGAVEQPDPIADKLMRDFAKEIIVTSRITKRKMFVYRLHVTLFSLGVIAYMLNCLLVN